MIIYEKFILRSAWLAAVLYGIAGIMLTYEVGARYLFIAPTSWAAELSQLTLIYGTLLAMPWALQHRRPIQINAIIHKLSDINQRRIGIIMMITLIVFSLYVVIYGFDIFFDSFQRGRTTGSLLDLPAWIAELPVPFCFLMLIIQAIFEIKKMVSGITPPSGEH
jgi:TRAP-type C4-dicarboxylate transport system permease small subunit